MALSREKLNQRRRLMIETAWDNYDFDREGLNVAAANGWEHNSPDTYSRVFFTENLNGDSTRHVFTVVFKPGTYLISSASYE